MVTAWRTSGYAHSREEGVLALSDLPRRCLAPEHPR